jgi:phage gp46-like protein
MAVKQDIKLTLVGSKFDISIADGELVTEDSFDTNIITSLFTEARASTDQVITPERRRGWIGTLGEEFILGTTAWVYGQLRHRKTELNELAGIYKLGLDHLIKDNFAKRVSVSINIEDEKAVLSIRIEKPNNSVDYRHFTLWENTGV